MCHAVRPKAVCSYCSWRPLPDGTPTHICIYRIFLATTESSAYILSLMISIYLRSNFSGALRKTILFLREVRFGRSRSSKVIIVGANWKRICDFLLVRDSDLCPIFHRFGDFADFLCFWRHPYSTLILGVFPPDRPCWGYCEQAPKASLFGREIIFEVFQTVWKTYLNVTYGQTDGRTDDTAIS